jgi:RNA polymerase sigma factor (sigma-70 family)
VALELDDAFWMEVTEFAAVAAAPVHRNFNKFIDFDDLKQSACEFAVKKKSKIIEYLDREDKQERRQGEAALIKMLRRHCDRVARKEKAARLGYQPEDEYFYRPVMVENLIKVWGSGDFDLVGQVFDPAEMGQKRKIKVASEGNDLLAMMADIDAAMKSLDSRTYGVLYLRLVDEMKLVEIAKEWEISPQRVDQIVQRGIRKIIEYLGGHTPY